VACTGPAGSLARWLDAVGPADVVLAKQTDPQSLRARWGIDREQNILHVARWVDSGKRDLAFWFGGRVLPGHGTPFFTPVALSNMCTFVFACVYLLLSGLCFSPFPMMAAFSFCLLCLYVSEYRHNQHSCYAVVNSQV
jgi:hypothetical protein